MNPSSRRNQSLSLWIEIGVRIALAACFLQLEKSTPFKRKIHPDELWHYRNPRTDDYVPMNILFPIIIIIPLFVMFLNYIFTKDRYDLGQGSLSLTLALGLNGVLTDLIKVLVGRPRPDFFWRCFPDGEMNTEMICTGDQKSEMDGRKSFPSGHSSFAFTGFGFMAWYLFGKLNVFNQNGRGDSWRLIISFCPLIAALVIAISRTCDYHHHWQDVIVGSGIGLCLSYLCYRQYYPSFSAVNCNFSYYSKSLQISVRPVLDAETKNDSEYAKLVEDEKEVKWI